LKALKRLLRFLLLPVILSIMVLLGIIFEYRSTSSGVSESLDELEKLLLLLPDFFSLSVSENTSKEREVRRKREGETRNLITGLYD